MEGEELRAIIGANIRRLASRRRMSLNQVADFSGMSRSHLYRVLRGTVSITCDGLVRIANTLECYPRELVDERSARRA